MVHHDPIGSAGIEVAKMTWLHMEAISKSHGNKTIIRDLDLKIREGEFVALVGPSGCGKTTLLQMLSGLEPLSQGTLHFGTPSPSMGVVFQNPRLLPWRTVRENLALVLGRHPDPSLIESWITRVGLADALDEYPERLSVGMMRRVALARAFAIEPDLLLMDEPLVSLDAPTARRMRELLLTLWAQRPHTVLFVTHDIREAIELSDRLVFVSASPMKVVADIEVAIPRQERNPERIEALISSLKEDLPELNPLI